MAQSAAKGGSARIGAFESFESRAMNEPAPAPPAPLASIKPVPSASEGAADPAAATRPSLPDHLSVDPRSPHHVRAVFEHEVGIRLNGTERFDVEEYCISEGWVKVPAGRALDRKGRPLLVKLKGTVEAFYR